MSLLTGISARFFYNGAPLNNGNVYVYRAGTTTLVDSFTDYTLSTAAANPAITNQNGEITLWLRAGQYKIRAETSGGTLVDEEDFLTVTSDSVRSLNVDGYGAFGDGTTHPLSGVYASLAAAQVDYPSAVALTDEFDLVAFESALAAIGDRVIIDAGDWGVYTSGVIEFTGDKHYLFNRAPTIAAAKNVHITSPAARGAQIEMTDAAVDYLFTFAEGSVNKMIEVSNLTLRKGGIKILAPNRGHVRIHDNQIIEPQQHGIYITDGSGVGVVHFRLDNNDINYAVESGIYIDSSTYLIGKVNRNRVNVSGKSSLYMDCIGVTVTENEFQGIADAAPEQAYVQIYNNLNGVSNISIVRNRFGSESYTQNATPSEAPRQAILLGPTTGAAAGGASSVNIRDNDFQGSSSSGTDHGTHAIRLNQRPSGWTVAANYFKDYFDALVDEAWWEDGTENPLRPSYWLDNDIQAVFDATIVEKQVFSNGGVNWLPQPLNDLTASQTRHIARNLLENADDFTVAQWSELNCTATKDATGPDGTANAAHTLTADSSDVDAKLSTNDTTTTTTGAPLTFGVWAKGGVGRDIMRLSMVRSSDSRHLHDHTRAIRLTDEWRFYSITNTSPGSGETITVNIFCGADDESVLNDTILLYQPILCEGVVPPDTWLNTPTAANLGVTRPAPLWQSLAIGDNAITYGTAAPTSGYWVKGDICIDTAPAVAGSIGWVCTTSSPNDGSTPGTWTAVGIIGAAQMTVPADLSQTIAGPSIAEVQAITDKVDALMAAIRSSNLGV